MTKAFKENHMRKIAKEKQKGRRNLVNMGLKLYLVYHFQVTFLISQNCMKFIIKC